MNCKKLTILFLCFFIAQSVQAQFSLRITEEHEKLKSAISNFELGHYHQTQQDVKDYLAGLNQKTDQDIYTATAHFYDLMSAMGQGTKGSTAALADMLLNTPYASLQQYGYFRLAKYLFSQQDYVQAIPFYETTDITYLSNQEISQRNFELAYCYLLNNQIEKVGPLFNTIKDVQGEYYSPGNYYNGVVAYYQGDYDGALKSFKSIETQEAYQEVVPFYIAELNYLKGDKNKALRLAKAYLKTDKEKYKSQMAQLASQIYFEKNDFTNAKKYIDESAQKGELYDDDYFRLGYTHYQVGDVAKAITYFEKVKPSNKSVGTQALYYLGLCQLKNGEKENALNTFDLAMTASDIGDLKEDISFNAAKLTYDLGKTVEAEQKLDAFINVYPSSKYYNDAVEMLALLTIKEKNFDKSITTLNKLGNLTPVFQIVYQKVNYARGIQMLKDGNASLAIPYFNEATKYPVNEDINGLSEFWKSECYYRLGQYQDAITSVNKFINKPGRGNNPALLKNASLSGAYIYYHLDDKENMTQSYVNYLDTVGGALTVQNVIDDLDTIKPNYVPSHIPFVETNPYIFIYKMPTQNVDFVYKPNPLQPIAFGKRTALPNNRNFIKATYGNLNTTRFDLGYDLSDDIGQDLYLNIAHRASSRKNSLQQASQNSLTLTHKRDIKQYRLTATLGLNRNVVHTYGISGADDFFKVRGSEPAKIRYFNPTITAEVSPIYENKLGLNYSLQLETGIYNRAVFASNQIGSNEINFRVFAPISKALGENGTLNMNVLLDANNNALKNPGWASPNYSTSIFALQPSYERDWKDVKISVGLYPTFGQEVHFLPNVFARKFISQIASYAQLGVESELQVNSFKNLSTLNPWLSPANNLAQTKRTLYYASLSGSMKNNLNFNFKAGYGRIKNIQGFISSEFGNNGDFYLRYADVNIVSLQAQAEYHINYNTNAGASLSYEPVLGETISHYVPLQFDVYAKYVYDNTLLLRADLLSRSGTTALSTDASETKLSGAFDLNLHANYLINNRWSVFLEGNNLLNNKYQRWNNYPNFGLNVLGGIVYSFNKSLSTAGKNLQIK